MSSVEANHRSFSVAATTGHRLLNAKFPPIPLFEDVASADDFDKLYALQTLTNPRLQTEMGNLSLLRTKDIPFGINGAHYAVASFTHVNSDGSRFSDGSFGLMYIGDSTSTAIAEVRHHQMIYWNKVIGLNYDRFVFKELFCSFSVNTGLDLCCLDMLDPLYAPDNYTSSRTLGEKVREEGKYSGIKYNSVRHEGGTCYALFTPKEITNIIQTKHYEMIWDGSKISSVNSISR